MSYVPDVVSATDIKASILKAGTPTSALPGGRFTLSGTVNGQASISSNRITLPTGRSYYLEGSILVQNSSRNGSIRWMWWDNTNSQYLGTEGFMNLATSFGAVTRTSRRVASALVLSSELTSSIDVELRIRAVTGTNWNLTITASGISSFDYVGYPSVRLLEIRT